MPQELMVEAQPTPENRSFEISQAQPLSGWSWSLSLALITFVALILRIVAIDSQSFWYDEAVTAKLTQASTADLVRGRVKDIGNPPLYWVLARGWSRIFGQSEIGFRSLSVIFGVLTVPMLALLGRRLLGPQVGLLAAALLAISPFHVELSNDARTYALLGFLIVLNTYFFVRWIERARFIDLALYSVTTFLSCYSHYYALILPLGHLACLVTVKRRLLLPWLGAMTAAGLIWLSWLPAFTEQLRVPGNLTREPGRWQYQFLSTPVVFSLGRTFAWRDSNPSMLGLAAMGTLLGFGIPAFVGLLWLRQQAFTATFLVTWLLLPILCPLIVALLFSPIYHTRAGSVGFLAFILLVAFGLTHFRPLWRVGTIALMLVLTTVSLYNYASKPLKDDWRSATPWILQASDHGEPVIFDTDIEVTSFMYYVPRFGTAPEKIIAVVSAEEGRIMGVRYQDGIRVDHVVREYGHEILSIPAGCLVLCVPSRPTGYYEELLNKNGYSIARQSHFHRIDVLYFVHRSNLVATP